MENTYIIFFIQKLINSYLFRLIVVLYGVVINLLLPSNLSFYLYLPLCAIYFFLYTKFRQKEQLRLINDLIFIFISTLYKDPTNILVYIFFLLLIFNRINFTGKRSNGFSLLMIVILVYSSSFILYYGWDVSRLIIHIIPFLLIQVITFITLLRADVREIQDELNSSIDSFYVGGDIRKPHRIYNRIIEVINSKIDLIDNIYCVTLNKEGKAVIVNSSNFVLNVDFDSRDIADGNTFKDVEVSVDKKKFTKTMLYTVDNGEFNYIFILVLKRNYPIYLDLTQANLLLLPVFNRIGAILRNENEFNNAKKMDFIHLSSRRIQFVKSVKTMHFIRNRLTALKNLTALVNQYITDKNDSTFQLLKQQSERSALEIQSIQKRATEMLDKSKNPFDYSELKPASIKNIYSIFKSNAETIVGNVLMNSNQIEGADFSNYFANVNIDGLEAFLSDWLSNIDKYYKDFLELSFNFIIEEDRIEIIFANNFIEEEAKIKVLIEDMTSNNRIEILKRQTHGVYLMQEALESMGVEYDVYILNDNEEKLLCFKLILEIYKNEKDSDI